MKKIISIVSTLALLVGFSATAFASMKVEGTDALPPVSKSISFEGQVMGADYFYGYGDHTKPTVMLWLFNSKDSSNIDILFDGDDAPYGMGFASAVGKTMTVYFVKNSDFEIDQLHVEKTWTNSDPKPALANYTRHR